MLDIIDNLNSLDLPLDSILVSFNIINMFPNIDCSLRLSFFKKYLDLCSKNIPPTNCQNCQKLLNYALHATIPFLIMRITYKQTTLVKDHTCRALMQILLWQILIRKLQNIISVPQHGKGLGMMFLYFGHVVENLYFYFQIKSTHLILQRK